MGQHVFASGQKNRVQVGSEILTRFAMSTNYYSFHPKLLFLYSILKTACNPCKHMDAFEIKYNFYYKI